MALNIMRWCFAVAAGCAALLALGTACMASAFGLFDASVIYSALCFPLFLLFLWRPTGGTLAFLGYLLMGLALGVFRPLRSGIEEIVTACVCGIGLSYACFSIRERKTSPNQ